MTDTPFTAYDMALLYNSRLFSEKINYLLGLDINGNKLSFSKSNEKIDYNNPCSALTIDEEEKRDIEESKKLIVKLQTLLNDTIESIIKKLNEKDNNKYTLSSDNIYYYDKENKNISKENLIKAARYIDVNKIEKVLRIGFFPTVFNEGTNAKEVSDYFLSVAIKRLYAKQNEDNSYPLYGKGEINKKEKDVVFFPICRKTLCVENYKECFTNKVINIIHNCIDMNKE